MNNYVGIKKNCDECEYNDNRYGGGCNIKLAGLDECPYRIDYLPTKKQFEFAKKISEVLEIKLPLYFTKAMYHNYIVQHYANYQATLLEIDNDIEDDIDVVCW